MDKNHEIWKAAYVNLWTALYGDESIPNIKEWSTLELMHEMENLVSYEIKEAYYSQEEVF